MPRSETSLPRHPVRLPCLLAAIALLAGIGPAAAAPPPVTLLSHRAAYRLSLAQADSGSGLAQVRGGDQRRCNRAGSASHCSAVCGVM